MKKSLTFIILSLLIGCCGENDLPESRLKGDVKMLTEYNVSVKYDSLNTKILDTLSVIKKYYNERNQIVEQNINYVFSDESMDITYTYNSCKRLKKERVKMSFDSNTIDVNYMYKGSLLVKSISESARDSTTLRQIGAYHYNSNRRLIKNSLSQLIIDLKTGDTIKNSLQTDNYNEKGLVMGSEMEYDEKPSQNGRSEYFYTADDLSKTLEYNHNDSLISTYRFLYKKDKLGNYIERKIFKDAKLNAIMTLNIKYRWLCLAMVLNNSSFVKNIDKKFLVIQGFSILGWLGFS